MYQSALRKCDDPPAELRPLLASALRTGRSPADWPPDRPATRFRPSSPDSTAQAREILKPALQKQWNY